MHTIGSMLIGVFFMRLKEEVISVLYDRCLYNQETNFESETWMLLDLMPDTCKDKVCLSHINTDESTDTSESCLYNR